MNDDPQDIKRAELRNEELRNQIKWLEKEIEKITENSNGTANEQQRINHFNKEIRKIKGNIQWQENRSRQASTICQRGY